MSVGPDSISGVWPSAAETLPCADTTHATAPAVISSEPSAFAFTATGGASMASGADRAAADSSDSRCQVLTRKPRGEVTFSSMRLVAAVSPSRTSFWPRV